MTGTCDICKAIVDEDELAQCEGMGCNTTACNDCGQWYASDEFHCDWCNDERARMAPIPNPPQYALRPRP